MILSSEKTDGWPGREGVVVAIPEDKYLPGYIVPI